MATAFSQAALAEAKRAMDEAQAASRKLADEIMVTLDQRNKIDADYQAEYAQIERDSALRHSNLKAKYQAERDRNQQVIDSVRSESIDANRSWQSAKADYEKMLALSRQTK